MNISLLLFFQAFPNEGLANVVRNVFDFDSYHPDIKREIMKWLKWAKCGMLKGKEKSEMLQKSEMTTIEKESAMYFKDLINFMLSCYFKAVHTEF